MSMYKTLLCFKMKYWLIEQEQGRVIFMFTGQNQSQNVTVCAAQTCTRASV